MKIMTFKKTISMLLALVFVFACLATMMISTSAGSYNRTKTVEFTTLTGIFAGEFSVNDTYYDNTGCLYINDTVVYEDNVLTAPYNYIVSGTYTFSYTDGDSDGGAYEKIANRQKYVYNTFDGALPYKTVKSVQVYHCFNYVNSVSNCSQANINTTFIIE